jgi:FkbM family methyltransferase
MTTKANEIELLQKKIIEVNPEMKNLFFIQIGSNDGKTLDPIHDYIKNYSWKGILIEPVPYLFEKLLETYQGFEGLLFENAAIYERDGLKKFYQLKENTDPESPIWYSLLGSFKKEILYKNIQWTPALNKYVYCDYVKCLTFTSILNKYQIEEIDLLHIDTEGYDYEIIKSIPFSRLKPKIILFEHIHLTKSNLKKCITLLSKNGYSIVNLDNDFDSLAFLS